MTNQMTDVDMKSEGSAENNEIIITDKAPPPVVAQSQSDQFLSTIQSAASDASVDMDKMERLYTMYEKVKGEEARVQYNQAMALCQGEMPVIEKTHENTQTNSMYAKIEDILKTIKPIYSKHGFSVALYPMECETPGFVMCGCDVSHAGGDTRHFEDIAPIDDKGIAGKVNKTQIHGRESAKSYAKRSLISSVFALEIGVQDDDGNSAQEPVVKFITDEQALTLEAFVTDNGLNMDAILDWIETKTGNRTFASIKAADYSSVMGLLKKKVAQREPGEDG